MGHHPCFTLLLLDVRFRRGSDVPGRSCSWGGSVLSCLALALSLSLLCVLPPPSLAFSGSARLSTAAYLLICIFNFYLFIVLFKSHFQE